MASLDIAEKWKRETIEETVEVLLASNLEGQRKITQQAGALAEARRENESLQLRIEDLKAQVEEFEQRSHTAALLATIAASGGVSHESGLE